MEATTEEADDDTNWQANNPGSSGPASLSHLGNNSDSPGLEYDLWEGQFEFLGGNPRNQVVYSAREELLQPVHDQVRNSRMFVYVCVLRLYI